MFACADVVLCKSAEVTRERGGKWRIKLKEGVANLAGNDLLFKECNSDLLDFYWISIRARRKAARASCFVVYRLTHIIRCAAIFHTDTLASKNYWADFHEILHGYLLDDYSSDSRGVFWNSIWNPRYRVPLGAPSWGSKVLKYTPYLGFQIEFKKTPRLSLELSSKRCLCKISWKSAM